MSIIWTATIAFMLNGSPYGRCDMIGAGGEVLSTVLAAPSARDSDVAIIHFDVGPRQEAVHFECHGERNG